MVTDFLRIEFTFGCGRTLHGQPILSQDGLAAVREIQRQAALLFKGYIMSPIYYGQTTPEGRLQEATGWKLSVILPCEDVLDEGQYDGQIAALSQVIKTTLAQDRVTITRSRVNFQ